MVCVVWRARARVGRSAYEMTLDQHRYGALIVPGSMEYGGEPFGPHLELSRTGRILEEASERIRAGEEI